MREIKFRIWHKPTKKYVTMSQEDWSYGKGKVKYKDSGEYVLSFLFIILISSDFTCILFPKSN